MPSVWVRFALMVASTVAGCTVRNGDHCYYNGGDAACEAQDLTKRLCNKCTDDNDGCVASIPAAQQQMCHDGPIAGTETGEPTTSAESSTTLTTTATTTTTTDPATTTGDGGSSSTLTTDATSESGEPVRCGNGMIDPGEECDGDLLEETCASLGYDGGMLSCTTQCIFDPTMCEAPQTCGNGVLDEGEQCDGELLTVPTCAEHSGVYGGGVLSCNANCSYDTDECCVAGGQLCNPATNCCHGNGCLLTLLCPLGAPP